MWFVREAILRGRDGWLENMKWYMKWYITIIYTIILYTDIYNHVYNMICDRSNIFERKGGCVEIDFIV